MTRTLIRWKPLIILQDIWCVLTAEDIMSYRKVKVLMTLKDVSVETNWNFGKLLICRRELIVLILMTHRLKPFLLMISCPL
ncbi:hypothetical protein [Methanobacterium ferruginis]|uniref:hypothetical protein n=1 Tax=Methanobacterium ferruginis TaxID=710191 RepID=UPI002572CDB2|nr:hypothetical protein [Methanobacterium ferruginis]